MIFIKNKYTNYYYNIVDKAKARTLSPEIYTEKHHIIPKSLGGDNSKDNLAKLTAREHFICHWLLTKMTLKDNRSKMLYALNGFRRSSKNQDRYSTKITSRVYANLKGKLTVTEETRKKQSISHIGKENPSKGKCRSVEQRNNMVVGNIGRKRKPHSEKTKEKQSISSLGKTKSMEHKEKLKGPKSEEHILKLKKKVSCPHCFKVGGITAMKRWHFANCANLKYRQT
jgi:hypothetical protein